MICSSCGKLLQQLNKKKKAEFFISTRGIQITCDIDNANIRDLSAYSHLLGTGLTRLRRHGMTGLTRMRSSTFILYDLTLDLVAEAQRTEFRM
jgi:hypothetical protein